MSYELNVFRSSGLKTVLGLLAVVGFVASANAQCPEQWLPGHGIPGLNGIVYAATTWDPDGAGPKPAVLVVGGNFTIAGTTVANRMPSGMAPHGSRWAGDEQRCLCAGRL